MVHVQTRQNLNESKDKPRVKFSGSEIFWILPLAEGDTTVKYLMRGEEGFEGLPNPH